MPAEAKVEVPAGATAEEPGVEAKVAVPVEAMAEESGAEASEAEARVEDYEMMLIVRLCLKRDKR